MAELHQLRQTVQLAPPLQTAGPGEDGGDGVGGGLLPLQVLVVVPGDGAVGRLELHGAVRRYQHGGHHGKTAEGGGHHVAHHVAVVVFQRPDEAAPGADHPRHRVIDERVEVGEAQPFKLRLVGGLILLLEDPFELSVVDLGDGVLGGEPQVLPLIDGVLEAAAGKGTDALLRVVLALPHGGTADRLNGEGLLRAALALEGEGGGARLLGHHVHSLVHIAVGVAGDGDGRLPVLHNRVDHGQDNGRPEGGAVQNRPDGAVGTLPHLRQLGVLLHPLAVGGDGGALHRHAQALGGVGGVDGHLVPRLVPMEQAQVIVLRFQVHEGQDQLFLDPGPQNPGHLIAVHLHQGGGHLDFIHGLNLANH